MSLIKKLHNKQATETKMISTSVKIPQVMDEIIADLAVFFEFPNFSSNFSVLPIL